MTLIADDNGRGWDVHQLGTIQAYGPRVCRYGVKKKAVNLGTVYCCYCLKSIFHCRGTFQFISARPLGANYESMISVMDLESFVYMLLGTLWIRYVQCLLHCASGFTDGHLTHYGPYGFMPL